MINNAFYRQIRATQEPKEMGKMYLVLLRVGCLYLRDSQWATTVILVYLAADQGSALRLRSEQSLCGLLWPSLIAGNFHIGPVERNTTVTLLIFPITWSKCNNSQITTECKKTSVIFNHILLRTMIYSCNCWCWPAGGSMVSQLVSFKFYVDTWGFCSSMAEDVIFHLRVDTTFTNSVQEH